MIRNSDTLSAGSINVTSITAVTQYIGSDSPSTSLTAFIYSAISRVSTKYHSYVGRPLTEQMYVGLYDGCNTSKLNLRNTPILSVQSIQYRNSLSDSWTSVDITNNLYVYRNYIELANTCFNYGSQNYRIIYTSGYSPIPEEVEQIAIEDIAIMIKESNIGGGKSLGILGQGSRNADVALPFNTTFIDLSSKHKEILNRYKVMPI